LDVEGPVSVESMCGLDAELLEPGVTPCGGKAGVTGLPGNLLGYNSLDPTVSPHDDRDRVLSPLDELLENIAVQGARAFMQYSTEK